MSHNLTKCILDTDTRITTSTESYIYECPTCEKQQRFAFPTDGSAVFCNGDDLGTRIEAAGEILEVSQAIWLAEKFNTSLSASSDDLGLEALGYVQNLWGVFVLTDLGVEIFEEIS